MFANSNLPDKRYRVCRSEEEIANMPSDSTDIFKKNMLDRYMDRPNRTFKNGKYRMVDSICFAEFLSNYYLTIKQKPEDQNDSQPEILEELIQEMSIENSLPKTLPLMSSKETLTLRKEKCVLRYHVPIREKHPESYAHHLLCMFFPFRNESNLNATITGTYSEKILEDGVLDTINRNKRICEPFGDTVDEAFEEFHTNAHNIDAHGEQENDEVVEELLHTKTNHHEDSENVTDMNENVDGGVPANTIPTIPDDKLHEKIRSLNTKQREIFEVVNKWAKDYIKSLSSVPRINVNPIHIFLTGSAGCGKSHLITTLSHTLTKALSYRAGDSNKSKVLMLAPTGVAAVNIDGNTIHSALGIPVDRNYSKNVQKLSDKKRSMLRNKFSELCVIVIDEISMVSNKLLLHIHQRLVEIGCTYDLPFAGISIIACGDFYQLPPIQQKPVYAEFSDPMLNFSHCWSYFKIAELTEVMRQRGDQTLINLLNNIRIGEVSENDERILKSKFINSNDPNYPKEAIHIWAENRPASDHNSYMLSNIDTLEYEIISIDKIPDNIPNALINSVYSRNQMETSGLAYKLILKLNAKVMLTSNVDVSDKLNNGQIGKVYHFKLDTNGNILKIYLKMEDDKAGLKAMNSDVYGGHHKVVPIERIEKGIKFKKNIPSSSSMKRLQFPLMLSWACTVHKVQGKQFPEIVINFDLIKQRSFNLGQIYVALSRVISLDGLYLTGTYNRNAIKADKKATKQYEYMRDNCQLIPIEDFGSVNEDSVTVTLLNTRSLPKHSRDIAADNVLMESDIICLTETQLTPNSDNECCLHLKPFLTMLNSREDRFSSILYGFKPDTVQLIYYQNIPGASMFQMLKPSFSTQPINFVLLYRKNSLSQNDCIYMLHHLINAEDSIHVILGDFNVNAFADNNYISEYLSDYKLVVNEATHISGSLIDHVYIRKDVLSEVEVSVFVKNMYFSDHDAVKFRMRNI